MKENCGKGFNEIGKCEVGKHIEKGLPMRRIMGKKNLLGKGKKVWQIEEEKTVILGIRKKGGK